MTVALTLAAYGAGIEQSPLPPDVVHHAKRAVVDWFAALIPGSVAAPARILECALSDDLGRGDAQLASGRHATPRTAALINATAAHTVEVDDIYRHAIYHPGAPTIAAALALGQAKNVSGLHFLKAVVAGYEISTRIGATLGRAHYEFWHNTGTVGTFGAAAAAATVLGLSAAPYAHALCTSATMAAGLQQAFRMDSMSKPLHAGHAAEAGLLAALAAEAGFTGSLDVLDGDAGMGRAMSNGPDWGPAVSDLGHAFNITDMTFKNHACCGHTFAAIDGALALKALHRFSVGEINRIRVSTYAPALAVAGNPHPTTAAEARFSLPYVVASALLYGSVRLAAFSDERLSDAAIRQLMTKIEVSVDEEIDAAFPGRRAARVQIWLNNGEAMAFFQPTRKGDPDAPLTDRDLDDKFLELAEPVLGDAAASRLLARLWALESFDGLHGLTDGSQ
ncbi:MmgE/PrpD family protein [Ottowia sp.]|uniref:MmgE/PrpD family protein n=1 Tax=Ottowia sp. TaxID=1898956 RepID=UPI002BD6B2CC|nr:MmgE/PrpD family protein [Ottowia sp.]HOB67173.1 MmgE/PrpD family protein [Ottowia sp.]HPZ56350.1 MmgE/PrpD family protein [Ottowia sp.]HQD48167.1 MmgE/PrpD family protein [Ottowia sp.]